MKIYTKLGDKGETSLIGGKRVVKHHIRLEAYGTVDELVAVLGVLRDNEIETDDKEFLLKTQHILMNCTAVLASEEENSNIGLPGIEGKHIKDLEDEIDRIEKGLPVLKNFVIPGGHQASSMCHLARNVCRRAERRISELSVNYPVDEMLKKYMNRLSDYLFVLARKILMNKGIDDIKWKY